MDYSALKHLHMTLAMISLFGFLLRGFLRLGDSPLLQRKWLRITPHVIDTLLLATALALVAMLQPFPFGHGWLAAKLLGLVVYIALGIYTLRLARTRAQQATGLVLAFLTFAYILAVAFSKTPLPFL